MDRKYMAEFGLNVFTSYKTIVPVEYFEKINDSRKYHIYFIMACSKVYIDPKSLSADQNGINLDLIELNDGIEKRIKLNSVIVDPELDHGKINLTSKYPYNRLEIAITQESFLKKYCPGKTSTVINIDSQSLINFNRELWGFEVLYIGKAYGENGNRTAQNRLPSHSTLQKILIDCHSKYQDKQLYIFLLEFEPLLNMSFDGITKKYSATKDEEEQHFENILSFLPEYQQVINITEAALINYFKPDYNTCFVENFPDTDHKGYRQYFSLDYNCLSVELDLEFDDTPCIQLYTNTNRINSSWDSIRYNLFNDENRKNMYDVFRER